MKRLPALLLFCAALASGGCEREAPTLANAERDDVATNPGAASATVAPPAPVAESKQIKVFEDVTEAAGIHFSHRHGGTGKKYLPETMGAGAAALDYDNDGWMDIYLVQSGSLTGRADAGGPAVNRLYRNLGNGSFADVTAAAGVGHSGYGMGAVAADYDNDGDADLYVVNFGPDVLYRNNADGTFTDVTAAAGIASDRWGSSAAFFDANRDGHLDLYVVNYLQFSIETHVDCGTPSRGIFSYCSPDVYPMAADVFYLANGDGTFTDATEQAGLLDTTGNGKGLGIVVSDFNNDGWPDIYIANDSTPNYLWLNQGDGKFEESGLWLGASHNEDGMTEAGMGVDAGDINGDGFLDVVVTNLSNESNAVYLGGEEGFTHESRRTGVFTFSLLPLGFGIDLLDVDNDADLDMLVVNGHVIDNIADIDDAQTARQPAQLLLNDGAGNFSEASPEVAGDIATPGTGRGHVSFDYNNDGWLDLLITYNNEPARLFQNTYAAASDKAANWIGFDLVGTAGNRDAVGAQVTVVTGSYRLTETRKAGSGYQTSSDPRMHFGLGEENKADRVVVRWPDGSVQNLQSLEGGQYHRLVQPE